MAEKEFDTSVPYIVYEGSEARAERHIKRLIIALIVVVTMLFATNLAWLWVWQQYEVVDTEVTYSQDGEGTNVIGTGNEVLYGTEVSHTNSHS